MTKSGDAFSSEKGKVVKEQEKIPSIVFDFKNLSIFACLNKKTQDSCKKLFKQLFSFEFCSKEKSVLYQDTELPKSPVFVIPRCGSDEHCRKITNNISK